MHQRVPKHPVEFDLVVLEDILEAAFGTILGDEAHYGRLDTRAQEAHNVVVLQVLDLHVKCQEMSSS